MAWGTQVPLSRHMPPHPTQRDQRTATPTFVEAEPRVLGGDVLPKATGIWMSHLQKTKKVCPRMLRMRTRGSHLMAKAAD